MICFVFWIDERLASAYKHTPCFISYPIESFFQESLFDQRQAQDENEILNDCFENIIEFMIIIIS